jgi:carboxylesterase type B
MISGSWGESAGAISAALQMVANNGDNEGLFRASFMQSGSPIPVADITHGQPYFDAIVSQTGCNGASDKLQCLRGVPYYNLSNAINASPGLFAYQV